MNTKITDNVNTDAVTSSLRAIKLLRCNVKDMFRMLAEGSEHQNAHNGAVSGDFSNDSKEDQEKNYLDELHGAMNHINRRIRELESSCAMIWPHPTEPPKVHLGNTFYLGQDPHHDKALLYGSMVTSYRWCNRLHDISSQAYQILNANLLKRTMITSLSNPMRNRFASPRRPITNGYNSNSQQVDNYVHLISRMFTDLKIELIRPYGMPTVLKITLDRVLKAVVVLRGLIIEWVQVKAFNEEFTDLEDKLDIWTESRYEVFRKITDHANSAMLHFSSPLHPDLALKSFIHWLNSYHSLFIKPCKKCEQRLKNSLPPTWRDQRTLEAYHESCRP